MTMDYQLSAYAQASQAAYAKNLVANNNNTARYEDTDVGMSTSQATEFDVTWNVLAQSAPNSSDGFSAVLLQNRITQEKVLAIAGTDPSSAPDLLTDVINILALGSVIAMPQYISLLQFYQQLQTSGLLTTTEQFSVTGHSLGGFLAEALAVNLSNIVTTAYTYNAPGFLGALGELLNFLGAPDSVFGSTITNVRAQEGISPISGLGIHIGTTVNVSIEPDLIPLGNHSIVKISDSLALQAILSKLDSGFLQETYNTLVQQASNHRDDALETLLNFVQKLFFGNSAATTSIGNRDELYTDIKTVNEALAGGGNLHALNGAVHIDPIGSNLFPTTTNEFSEFVSLYILSPVVLSGNNPANQILLDAKLGEANNELYQQWQADQLLTADERVAGKANFSDQWLSDRAAMLDALITLNTADATLLTTDGETTRYTDSKVGSILLANVDDPGLVTISFGSVNNQPIAGDIARDRCVL